MPCKSSPKGHGGMKRNKHMQKTASEKKVGKAAARVGAAAASEAKQEAAQEKK